MLRERGRKLLLNICQEQQNVNKQKRGTCYFLALPRFVDTRWVSEGRDHTFQSFFLRTSPLGSAHGPLLLLPPVLGVDRLAEEALRGLIDLRRHLAYIDQKNMYCEQNYRYEYGGKIYYTILYSPQPSSPFCFMPEPTVPCLRSHTIRCFCAGSQCCRERSTSPGGNII